MTFDKAAWAIDGPTIGAALGRISTYVGTGGSEGVVGKTDFKVSPTSPLTRGLVISGGAGLIRNRYQGASVNQSYAVSNTGDHTITSGSMPAVSASAQEFLVLVTVGDEEFSQVGHPWMSGDPIEDPDDFQYVRPIVYGPVTAGATVESLNLPFPAVAIARLNIPASATNITSGMITDLRTLAQPRTQTVVRRLSSATVTVPNSYAATNDQRTVMPPAWYQVQVPTWANVVKVFGTVDGLRILGNGRWTIRPILSTVGNNPTVGSLLALGPQPSFIDWAAFVGEVRTSLGFSDTFDVTAVAGQNIWFGINIAAQDTGYNATKDNLVSDAFSGVAMTILFEEVQS